MTQNFFYIPLTRKETVLGWLYLSFQLLVLPMLLRLILAVLMPHSGSAELNISYFLLNFLAVMLIFGDFLRRTWQDLHGRVAGILWKAALAAVLAKVVTTVMNDFFFFYASEYFYYTDTGPVLINPNDTLISQIASEHYGLTALCTVFLVPVSEELLHRGVVFGSLYKVNPWLGWIVSVFLFAAIHVAAYFGQLDSLYFVVCFLQYVPGAMFLNWLYVSTDSIFAPILMHILFNAMGFF